MHKILKDHTGIFGKTQSGKTYFFTHFLFNHIKVNSVMFDIKLDKTISKSIRDFSINSTTNLKEIDFNKSKKWVLRRKTDETRDNFLSKCFRVIEYYFDNTNYIYFFIDEIGQYTGKLSIPDTLEKLLTMGLGKNKICVWNTQRPQSIHNDVITQTTDFFIFKISNNDYDWLERFGYVPQNSGKKWINQKYHYIYYDGIKYHYVKPI